MDFTPNPEQQAVADVVTSVLERDNTWDALVSGGVAALGVPDRLGGDGLGLPELSTALTEIGRHGTTGPALATVGLGLVSLLDLASEAQQDRYLSGVAGGAVLSAALNEPGQSLPERPATNFAEGKLNGTKIGVPYAETAKWLVVTTDNAVVVVSPAGRRCDDHQNPDLQRFRRIRRHVRRCRGRCRRCPRRRECAPGQPAGTGRHRRVRGRAGGRRAAVDGRLRGDA